MTQQDDVQLTQEGHDQIVAELKELKEVKLPVAIQRVATARSFGDLSENAEYQSAREDLAFLEGKISELEGIASKAKILKNGKGGKSGNGVINLGSMVTLKVGNSKHIYHIVKGALIVILSLIYLIIGVNGLGYQLAVGKIVSLAVGILFIVIGYYLKGVKPNWFFGIRTPWTLADDRVWDATHRLGARLFKWCAYLALVGILFPPYTVWFIVAPILAVALYLTVSSYFAWQKLGIK